MTAALRLAFEAAVLVVAAYFVLSNGFWSVLFASAGWQMLQHRRARVEEDFAWLLSSAALPRVSVLVPAHNEAETIEQSLRALLTLEYPALEVVVVNDGSTDATLATLIRSFDLRPIHLIFRQVVATQPLRGLYRSRLYPGLVVADKVNGGKADALNAGLNLATCELVCDIDADTILEPDALLRIVQPFLNTEGVVAAGGTIRVVNSSDVRAGRVVVPRAPRNPVAGIQAVEYLRAFLFGRLGWNLLGGNLIISGAFGLFRRDALRAIGGYESDSVGEDMEVVVRLRRLGLEQKGTSRVVFVPEPVAWTEAPESLRLLGRQRDRWQRGLLDVVWRHRAMVCNPRYRAVGLVVLPYFVVVELLGPVIEVVGLVAIAIGAGLGLLDVRFALLFFLVVYGWGLLFSAAALLLDELSVERYAGPVDRVLLLCWALLEPLGYRQLGIVWQLRGMARGIAGRSEWGDMARRGFSADRSRTKARDEGNGASTGTPRGRHDGRPTTGHEGEAARTRVSEQ